MKTLMFFLIFFIYGCTYSITMVHTEGSASDVVDTEQRADPDVTTDLSIPVKGI